jgi:hypothetical protein
VLVRSAFAHDVLRNARHLIIAALFFGGIFFSFLIDCLIHSVVYVCSFKFVEEWRSTCDD